MVDKENGIMFQQFVIFPIGGCHNSLEWLSIVCFGAAVALLHARESSMISIP